MIHNNVILKGTTHLLLGVMLYTHVCSAWCASFSGGCCSEGKENNQKSACHHDKKSDRNTGNCQDYHLSFFNAAGQFASEKNVDVVKIFPFQSVAIPTFDSFQPVESGKYLVSFNNYHPPPPIADIRIFIQSFQI
ncbi:MAG TPA: hypothetical protein VFG10_05340 [Saprospiraceae bacterium]|nr:hypothetical protein [Saprospiraceae bacterium]